MTRQVQAVVRELAGRASVRLLTALRVRLSRHTAIRVLLGIPLPPRPVPRVLSVDDFALRRRHRYASVIVDAITHDRVDVLPDRKADTLAEWLQEHPGVEIVVRDGSATYAEAVRRALPGARQVSDRWHLWHGLVRGVEKVVVAHSDCWAKLGPERQSLTREKTTIERWHAVHSLLERGVGLLDCSRRLGLSLNTVKRYARVPEPQRLRRPPQHRACLVDEFRDLLRARRAADPGVSVQRLFDEITELGYRGSLNLLYKYINQGRMDGDRIMPSPRRLTRWLVTRPADLSVGRQANLDLLLTVCPEMTALAEVARGFAGLMADRRGTELDSWITQVRACGLVELEPFLAGLEQDHDAAVAGLAESYNNGPTEGINTKTKLIKRQRYSRAGFSLLRHRVLLG
jgi:transposase